MPRQPRRAFLAGTVATMLLPLAACVESNAVAPPPVAAGPPEGVTFDRPGRWMQNGAVWVHVLEPR
jgi:hypothetical protein